MPTGAALIRDIDARSPQAGEMDVWWLGQHSFIVKAGPEVIYLDPFLSPMAGRRTPPLLAPEQIRHATIITGSHDHADHIDRKVWPALAEASPAARFILPDLLREDVAKALRIPAERLVGLDDGKTVQIGTARVTGVAAAHEFLDQDQQTGRFPYLGFVFEVNRCTFYHSGDCCMYEGLETKLRRWRFDAMFLPINGRDAARYASGCIGNMTYQEAADLAGALRPRLVVPAHYDMFATNLGDPAAFAAYVRVKYPAQAVHVFEYGECLRIST